MPDHLGLWLRFLPGEEVHCPGFCDHSRDRRHGHERRQASRIGINDRRGPCKKRLLDYEVGEGAIVLVRVRSTSLVTLSCPYSPDLPVGGWTRFSVWCDGHHGLVEVCVLLAKAAA